MTDPTAKLWRIRPLEWGIRGQEYCAESHEGQWWVMQCRRSGLWHYAPPLSGWVPCDSLSDGKSKCEALYAERMARGLEPVPVVPVSEAIKEAKQRIRRAIKAYHDADQHWCHETPFPDKEPFVSYMDWIDDGIEAVGAARSGLEPVEGVGVDDTLKLLSTYCIDLLEAVGKPHRDQAKLRAGYAKLESAIRTLAGQERGNG